MKVSKIKNWIPAISVAFIGGAPIYNTIKDLSMSVELDLVNLFFSIGVIIGELGLIVYALKEARKQNVDLNDDTKMGSLASSSELINMLKDMKEIALDKKTKDCLEYAIELLTKFRTNKVIEYFKK